ncbi:ABC transporter ATP-binding protein [Pseudomonas amygdali pv. lachrymans]|uniref:ABC-type dipeptide transporter n=3 Tax=Pseudomonas amygdali TaxID=47877 RepID=A0AB37R7M5_PSEAV|nr:ABC transporter ATP-binding protein [Pseudomonas amygdali]ARA81278.1 ABC transporter ATP-binding protein [Pseudomonas amygdali pv. lachrymans]AXH56761.1 ABC transporter ATP-binding protein [Pseudomonas amygdali pv. lachrymans str. M301315]KPC18593.1 Oligopeptide/dipeptide ABC transporter [Pseudomonas amygdali pv. lachrymans]PWD03634.1 ABC transporter ATP-binding protein [Pseudomonas amygdali pv. lachrymans]QWA48168.1 ABC transporter ATP-binding protein [Pseudomonas amygdali pv. lachrymans]
MALLHVENLRVEIPLGQDTLHAVRGLDFQVERGEMLCIVGESGCGKSLTSLALMDLLPRKARRTATTLSLDGIDMLTQSERQMCDQRGNRLAMIFQEPMTSLNPAYSIGDQLSEVLTRHRNVSRKEALQRAAQMLEKVGISNASERLRQYPHQLSGGLRQRVIIAMALMCEPDVIIADEPTTALDVTIQAQILRLIRDIQKELGLAVIFITHDLGLVARIADRVAVMYAGQIVETAPAVELFENPQHPYTRGLLASIPIPGRTQPGQPLGSIPGLVPSLVGEQHGCAFRNRCSLAIPACAEDVPPINSQDHMTRCLFASTGEETVLHREGMTS